ncbi:MAG: cytochrome c3 family protein [Pseudomonadota bacterium]
MKLTSKWGWAFWLVAMLPLSGYLGTQMFVQPQKPDFLIGQTTHGHHQIELECTVCHQTPFGGKEVLQEACVSCHAAELKVAQDSHPKTKFTDPRNVDRLEKVDARYCVACHAEHNEDITRPMGVTMPTDYCFHCHQDIAEDRASHEGMAFDTFASSGCHNFHDNRALYEDFLVANAHSEWLLDTPASSEINVRSYVKFLGQLPEQAPHNQIPEHMAESATTYHSDWAGSAHQRSNVGCNSCHGEASDWQARPAEQVCMNCHQQEVETFKRGKHGMRLAQNLSPMTPAQSMNSHGKLAFKSANLDQTLTCNTCHNPHSVNRQEASVASCLSCHDDKHSLAFENSPHGKLWQAFLKDELPEAQAVSCATCHLPRIEVEQFNETFTLVQHNQNDTLRPNEKMIRPVCMDCHGLTFAIDALADETLIVNNFAGQPGRHIESVDLALKRVR